MQKAKDEISSLQAEIAKNTKEIKILKDEAERQQSAAQDLLDKYSTLQQHHSTAWLPHWLDEQAGVALVTLAPVISKAADSVKQIGEEGVGRLSEGMVGAWENQVKPALQRTKTLAKVSQFGFFCS